MICSQINNLRKCTLAICCSGIFDPETVMVHVESLNYDQFFPHMLIAVVFKCLVQPCWVHIQTKIHQVMNPTLSTPTFLKKI